MIAMAHGCTQTRRALRCPPWRRPSHPRLSARQYLPPVRFGALSLRSHRCAEFDTIGELVQFPHDGGNVDWTGTRLNQYGSDLRLVDEGKGMLPAPSARPCKTRLSLAASLPCTASREVRASTSPLAMKARWAIASRRSRAFCSAIPGDTRRYHADDVVRRIPRARHIRALAACGCDKLRHVQARLMQV
jgi:hypothetical protein